MLSLSHSLTHCVAVCAAQVLQQQLRGVAVLQVAHSLSAVAAYDRVLLMEGGHIVEAGPPGQLLSQGGSRFAALAALARR